MADERDNRFLKILFKCENRKFSKFISTFKLKFDAEFDDVGEGSKGNFGSSAQMNF